VAVAAAGCLPTATNGRQNSYTTPGDTTLTGVEYCPLSVTQYQRIGALIGVESARRSTDSPTIPEQQVDPLHRLQRRPRDRRRVLAAPLPGRDVGELKELAPGMRPARRRRKSS